MRKIPLRGKYKHLSVMVDDEDYEWLSQWKWKAHIDRKTVYAKTSIPGGVRGQETIFMHRLVMKATGSRMAITEVDHRDFNGLNNQKKNLRLCMHGQNQAYSRKHTKETSSKFKGVTWFSSLGKWRARMRCDKVHVSLGLFDSEEEAAKAYDEGAIKYFGDFANLNFPYKPRQVNDVAVTGSSPVPPTNKKAIKMGG